MNSMSPWTPEQIGKLTPIQLFCMVSKHPPGRGRIESSSGLIEIIKAQEQWNKD